VRRVVASTLAALVLSVAGPAAADDGSDAQRQQVGLSLDGVHYQHDIDQPLFDPALRWVPGDVRRSSFWVRNQAVEPGDLTIDVLALGRKPLLDSRYLSISARTGDGPWQTMGSDKSMHLLTQKNVPANSAVPVTVQVALAPEATNGTMLLATDLDFGVTLTDARATAAGGGSVDHPDGPGGLLPDTGSSASWWALPLALLLLLVGVLVLSRRRPADLLDPGPHVTGETR